MPAFAPFLFLSLLLFSHFSVFLGFYLVLLGFIGFYWVLLGFTGLYWVLLGFTGFYRVLPGFTGFYLVLSDSKWVFTEFYWVLLGFTGFYWVLLGFTGFYWVLPGFNGSGREVGRRLFVEPVSISSGRGANGKRASVMSVATILYTDVATPRPIIDDAAAASLFSAALHLIDANDDGFHFCFVLFSFFGFLLKMILKKKKIIIIEYRSMS